MIRNYFKIAWRNLLKNKGFSFINIFGLSIGVAACILISIYILHESSYDKHVSNSENIYRMTTDYSKVRGLNGTGIFFSANTAPTVLNDFEEVENTGRLMAVQSFYGAGSNDIRFDGEATQHYEEGFAYADQSIIDIMDVQMVYGDAKTALDNPKTIVISEKIANKYFKNENPIGRTIFLNGNSQDPFKINGVMKDFATNSHMDYDFLMTLKDVEFGEGTLNDWSFCAYFTYVLLKPDIDIKAFEQNMNTILIKRYLKPAYKAAGFPSWVHLEERMKIGLQPLTDINLYSSHIFSQLNFSNDIKTIWIFGIVALFILIIASINFVNLSTAKSANRAKEVGLRKVVGSTRRQLIGQFLAESILISLIAFSIGIVLSALCMPLFRSMCGIHLVMPWSSVMFIATTLLTSLIVGILAGLYPSFHLSKFNPVNVLKGRLSIGNKSNGLRGGLVVFQFTISIVLIVGTLIVDKQLQFILNSKIGFEKDQVVQLYSTNLLNFKTKSFRDELKTIPGVANASISDFLPLKGSNRGGEYFVKTEKIGIDESIYAQLWSIDENYIETLGIQLLEGRNFFKKDNADRETIIINQALVKALHLENPIGKNISREGGRSWEIIGIVEDFNYDDMKQTIKPLCFVNNMSNSVMSVKLNTTDVSATLAAIAGKWKAFVPDMAFRYKFMDASFANMYENVSRIKAVFTTFAILAILVACLGLLALSAYMVEQRNREMSIRKVLGASVQTIFKLLTKNFLVLVIIALAVAIPVAYYLMQTWLQDYEYKIDMSWSVFAIAGIIALAIALLTISYHAMKSALINPAKVLRTE